MILNLKISKNGAILFNELQTDESNAISAMTSNLENVYGNSHSSAIESDIGVLVMVFQRE